MKKKETTVGKVATELQSKMPEKIDPIAVEKESHKDYIKNLTECVIEARKIWAYQDIYVEVQVKKERLLENVLRNYFIARQSCPTPNYDQSVYRYNHENESIEYLWNIPDRETCLIFLRNKNFIVPEERELLSNVIKFADGTYYLLMKKLNNEEDDSCLLKEH